MKRPRLGDRGRFSHESGRVGEGDSYGRRPDAIKDQTTLIALLS